MVVFSTLSTHVFYILIISLASLFVLLSQHVMTNSNSLLIHENTFDIAEIVMLVVSFVVLIFPLVNRTCGADTEEYYRIYTRDYTDVVDFTFNYICKILHFFIPSPKIGLGIISVITLLIVFWAFLRVKDQISISYSFFAYFTTMYFYLYNYMRIMVAVSLIILGYSCIVKDEKYRALLLFGLAIFFHRSACVVLAVYLLIICFGKYKKTALAMSCIAIIVFIMKPYFFLGLISIDHYSSQIDYSTISSTSIGLGTIIRIAPFFVLLFIYRFQKNEKIYDVSLYFCIANLAFSLIGYYVSTASRISNMYFVFHLLFFAPWIIKQDSDVIRRRLIGILFIVYCVISYYLLTFNFGAMMIMPYR